MLRTITSLAVIALVLFLVTWFMGWYCNPTRKFYGLKELEARKNNKNAKVYGADKPKVRSYIG